MTKRKSRRLRTGRLLLLITAFCVVIGGFASLGYFAYAVSDMPAFDATALENMVPTSIYDKDGNLVTRVGTENREPIQLEEVPAAVKDAFLATEDDRFYDHHGINFRSLGRAVVKNVTSGEIREGFSTITMQLVKLSYLSPEKSIKRKLQEVVLTLQMERNFTKDEIFEMYLNKIYFGQGAYGIQAAAQTYLGKDLKNDELTLDEAAFLAGLPQAPSSYSRYLDNAKSLDAESGTQEIDEKQQKDYDLALNRRNTVLFRMKEAGKITEQEQQEAATKPLPDGTKMQASRYPYPYFIDYVTEKLMQKYGPDMVYKGGLKVYTTLDPKVQKLAELALANPNNYPRYPADKNGLPQPQGAAVFMEPGTGYLRAIVGGREHTQQRQLNRATQYQVMADGRKIGRQPGSSIKPLVAYGPAIEYKNKGPATIIDDTPTNFGSYSPKNSDGQFRGLITMRAALTSSVNVVAVKLLNEVGLSQAAKFAQGVGISTLEPDRDGLAMALGGVSNGVVPLDMAGAYGAIANQGIYVKPHAIIKVERYDGTVVDEFKPEQKRAMKATTAYLLTDMLRSVVQSGTGTRANLGARPVAGKTGTTDDGRDIWFVGYTPELVGAVWMGHDNPKPMRSSYGGIYPAMVWREVMNKALSGVPVRQFTRPSGLVTATVDSKSGLLPGPNTPADHMVSDLFAQGTVPQEVDNLHQVMEVCATTGELPNDFCPDRITKVVVKTPYTVPNTVADFAIRAPLKTCELHTENGIDPAAAEKYKFLLPTEPSHSEDGDGDDQPAQTNQPDSWLPGPTGFKELEGEVRNNVKKAAHLKETLRDNMKN